MSETTNTFNDQTKKDLWQEWWIKIRNLNSEKRNRALTKRCQHCGKGSLDNIKTTFINNSAEATCENCF